MKSSPAISVCIFLFKIDEIENGDLAKAITVIMGLAIVAYGAAQISKALR